MRAHEWRIDSKLIGWEVPTGLKKRGVMTAAHPRTTFQSKCPPVFHCGVCFNSFESINGILV